MSTDGAPVGQQLRRLADEIRLKVHLAEMDARDAWGKLEPKLHAYERQLEAAGGSIARDVSKVGHDLKEEMRKLLHLLPKEGKSS